MMIKPAKSDQTRARPANPGIDDANSIFQQKIIRDWMEFLKREYSMSHKFSLGFIILAVFLLGSLSQAGPTTVDPVQMLHGWSVFHGENNSYYDRQTITINLRRQTDKIMAELSQLPDNASGQLQSVIVRILSTMDPQLLQQRQPVAMKLVSILENSQVSRQNMEYLVKSTISYESQPSAIVSILEHQKNLDPDVKKVIWKNLGRWLPSGETVHPRTPEAKRLVSVLLDYHNGFTYSPADQYYTEKYVPAEKQAPSQDPGVTPEEVDALNTTIREYSKRLAARNGDREKDQDAQKSLKTFEKLREVVRSMANELREDAKAAAREVPRSAK